MGDGPESVGFIFDIGIENFPTIQAEIGGDEAPAFGDGLFFFFVPSSGPFADIAGHSEDPVGAFVGFDCIDWVPEIKAVDFSDDGRVGGIVIGIGVGFFEVWFVAPRVDQAFGASAGFFPFLFGGEFATFPLGVGGGVPPIDLHDGAVEVEGNPVGGFVVEGEWVIDIPI